MPKTMSELLANSFQFEALVSDAGKIVLPPRIIEVMGRRLKGEYCNSKRNGYLLVSKLEDEYFAGEPLMFRGKHLWLTQEMSESLTVKREID